MQSVYSIAERKLAVISTHPFLVEGDALGYFMSVESIKKAIGSFNPKDWYKGEKYDEKDLSFNDLPKEDRIKLIEILKELTESTSQSNLKCNCWACNRLADEFGNKILAREIHNEEDRRFKELDDDNIPVVRGGESIQEFEEKAGHGFYGNQSTGYIHEKDAK